jgi:hypothetical protein
MQLENNTNQPIPTGQLQTVEVSKRSGRVPSSLRVQIEYQLCDPRKLLTLLTPTDDPQVQCWLDIPSGFHPED